MMCALKLRAWLVQLLDALAEAGNGPDRDLQLATLRVCARAGNSRAAQRIWDRLQNRGASIQVFTGLLKIYCAKELPAPLLLPGDFVSDA